MKTIFKYNKYVKNYDLIVRPENYGRIYYSENHLGLKETFSIHCISDKYKMQLKQQKNLDQMKHWMTVSSFGATPIGLLDEYIKLRHKLNNNEINQKEYVEELKSLHMAKKLSI